MFYVCLLVKGSHWIEAKASFDTQVEAKAHARMLLATLHDVKAFTQDGDDMSSLTEVV